MFSSPRCRGRRFLLPTLLQPVLTILAESRYPQTEVFTSRKREQVETGRASPLRITPLRASAQLVPSRALICAKAPRRESPPDSRPWPSRTEAGPSARLGSPFKDKG